MAVRFSPVQSLYTLADLCFGIVAVMLQVCEQALFYRYARAIKCVGYLIEAVEMVRASFASLSAEQDHRYPVC